MQLSRIFQSGAAICWPDKITLFFVINLLSLGCIAERAHNLFSFNGGLRFLQHKSAYLESGHIGSDANRYFDEVNLDKKRHVEL